MPTTPIDVYIGYDPTESAAFYTLAHSIYRHASQPVRITALRRSSLNGSYRRPRGPTESTEFSITRFLVPYLSGHRGMSIFLDCDMLCRSDIVELLDYADPVKAVSVVQHDYEPRTDNKMLGQVQTRYAKKNWSSLMIFQNILCWKLTPHYVNSASGLDLHQFTWADEVGSIPLEWNWLVGEYDYNPEAKIAHFTLGGPWWEDYQCADYADEWLDELDMMLDEKALEVDRETTRPLSRVG